MQIGEYMRRWQRYILIVFIYIGLFLALFAVPQTTAAQRVVRVGWYEAPGLQEGTSADNLSGFNYEYLVRIAQYADWQYDFVFGDFGTLEKELIAGNIDIMGDVAKTEARLSLYDYCAYPSCYSHTLLLCRPEDMRFAYNDYGSFDGIVVGNSGSAFRKSMLDREAEEQHFRVTYRDYDTDGEMLTALTRGDVDTAVISDALQHKQYKILHEWEPAAQYFIVHKGSTDILMELNNAMSSIQSADRSIQAHLFEKYFGGDNSDFSVALTREEMAYVAGAPTLTVLLAENQKPLSYIENGQAKGFIPDYLGLISAQTGLRFTYIWCRDHAEMVQRFEAGEGDICGQAHDNYGQSQGVRIKRVQPYVNLSYGLVYNPAVTQTVHTVAVEELDALMIDRLKKMGFTPVAFRTPRECLDAVNDQHVDAAAMANNIFEQLAYHAAYIDLVYKAQSGLDVGLCLGVSKQESPYLFRILSKATGVVPPNVIAQLMLNNNSLPPQYTIEDYIYLNRNFLYIIVILIIIILFLALWYRRQKRYNQYMHQAAEAKAAFFNNLSHDLRTPLTGILGYSELAVKEECADKKQLYLDKINMSGKVLLDLINDTLSLAKIERERFALSPTSFNVYSFLQATILSIQSQTQQKEQQFHCFFKIPQDEWIVADKLKFQDVLLNILLKLQVQIEHL
jgi:ABC-type amino acid transport substrate-binding protein